MIRIEGCTEEECRAIERSPNRPLWMLVGQGVSKPVNQLTTKGEIWIDGYRFASSASAAAQAVLAVLAIKVPLKIETQEADNTPWVPYRSLLEAVSSYRRSLAPAVDIEALELEVERTKTILADHVAILGHNHKTEEKFAADYRDARGALEKAKIPKPKTELDLAREALTRLRTYIGNGKMDYINSEWRVVVEALEEWEKAR